jgi:shikimate dehydrogenase/3-dehydroquinate dehydratase type I
MICIPITAKSNKEALREIKRCCAFADFIELRMDLIADGNLSDLIAAIRSTVDSVKIIVTCRKKEEDLSATELPQAQQIAEYSKTEKIDLLKKAIDLKADFVDIELMEGSDAIDELRDYCAKSGRVTGLIISYHDIKKTPSVTKLQEVFHQAVENDAAVVKIVTFAKSAEDNLKVLGMIPYAQKHSQKIIAMCMGAEGRISRIAAPLLGAYLSFATQETCAQSAPGQLTVSQMRQINNLIQGNRLSNTSVAVLSSEQDLQNYVLLGNPVAQSLSPLMHNAALKEMGIDGRYSAFCVSNLESALCGIKGMNIRGASVTIPYKVSIMEYLDEIDEDALNIGAVNTIVNNNGRLIGYNTDWLGLMVTIKELMPIKDQTFVIIGAGGTARAAVYGIIKEGGLPIIVNRTIAKGKSLSNKFKCPFYSFADLVKIKADFLINTTPIGMYPNTDQSPVETSMLTGYKYVIDVIYNPQKTKLLCDAEAQGCRIVSGLDMFVHQGAEQLKLWTGIEPPRALMKKVVTERLNKIEN